MKNIPRVTVLMSVYNGEKYLREAIDSVLSQTFGDFELLIINDGSTDGTWEILESYKDARIRLFNQDNMGLTRSLNKGIQLSRCEYIARMDADDIALPERLGKQVRFLDEHPEIAAVGSFHHEENLTRAVSIKKFPADDPAIRKILLKKNPISHPTVMIRRSILIKIGCYNEGEEYKYIEDYELWSRLARAYKLANIPEALVIKRFVPTSICVIHDTRQLENTIHLKMKMLKEGISPWWYAVYLIKPYVACKTPAGLRNLVRKYLLRNRMHG